MKTTKILTDDIASLKVAALPSRPTSSKHFGGLGYSSAEMKAAFDRLPLYIVDKFNDLIDDIYGVGETSLAAALKTGIRDEHSLSDLFSDIGSGAFASYLNVNGSSLAYIIADLEYRISALEEVNK